MDHTNTYKELMGQVKPPAYLKERVVNEMRILLANEARSAEEGAFEQTGQTEQTGQVKQTEQAGLPKKNPQQSVLRKRKRGLALLSAAAAIIIAVFVVPLVAGLNGGSVLSNGIPSQQTNNTFILAAYANTPETQYPHMEGLLTFGHAGGGAVGESAGGEYATWLFDVEGEGIAQVDFELSRGEIYCFATQNFSNPNDSSLSTTSVKDREAAHEALKKKLGGDFASGGGSVGWSTDKTYGGAFGHVSGARTLGSSPSIKTTLARGSYDLEQLSFGFYVAEEDLVLNHDLKEDFFKTSSALMAALDEQTLSVHVKFVDGTSASQTYILRVKKMKVVLPVVNIQNEEGKMLSTPYISEEATNEERFGYVLFGEPVYEESSFFVPEVKDSQETQSSPAKTEQMTAEFLIVNCTMFQGSFELKLDDLKNEDLRQLRGYTHITSFSGPGSSDYLQSDSVEIIDEEGRVIEPTFAELRGKYARITFFDCFYYSLSGITSSDVNAHKVPGVIRGVSRIEIIGDPQK